jgi:hypothetical protein
LSKNTTGIGFGPDHLATLAQTKGGELFKSRATFFQISRQFITQPFHFDAG